MIPGISGVQLEEIASCVRRPGRHARTLIQFLPKLLATLRVAHLRTTFANRTSTVEREKVFQVRGPAVQPLLPRSRYRCRSFAHECACQLHILCLLEAQRLDRGRQRPCIHEHCIHSQLPARHQSKRHGVKRRVRCGRLGCVRC